MSTPESLRAEFILKAGPLIDQYVDAALGKAELKATSGQALTAVWELLSDIIKQAGDKAAIDIDGDDISEKIEDLLNKVSKGVLTPEQGKKYMTLIQSGFELTELPALVEKIESMSV